MFDPKHPRGTYSGTAAMKPQYVLITENGKERTSNVTVVRIMEAVYKVDIHEYVTIEKCLPVRLIRSAELFALSFYKDSHIAAYFRVGKTILRMVRSGFSVENATDVMCDFFQLAKIPDVQNWTCEELKPAPRKVESTLTVDGEDFRYFGCADVMAALENIIEGKSKWLLHDFTDEDGGYINIHRCDDNDGLAKYKVELVRWTKPIPTGYRFILSDVAPLRRWLWDFTVERTYPDPLPEWETFDVTDYFQRLAFRFLDEEDKLDKKERDER
ncbi:hypothetical protein [Bacteroides acidifaciens]|uniref:hypothetical protein n=1 Tax=Bacteroides acidifaciens TaxID=85831 RepID=UPI0023C85235|nr:hypothetical protein [Bacteroides acidifaciens]MDE6821413.1 hypothetical protein [Bacteroides acidifaciens]